MGSQKRISPEAPVPVVNGEKILNRLGGAGNVAANVASLGCSVSLLGYVGQDEDGDIVRQLLQESQIESALISRENPQYSKNKSHISRTATSESRL